MTEEINVKFPRELWRFIQSRTGGCGPYASASEYIRDLVRRDYEREEQHKWHFLRRELMPGLKADEGEFVPLNAGDILDEGKARRKGRKRGS